MKTVLEEGEWLEWRILSGDCCTISTEGAREVGITGVTFAHILEGNGEWMTQASRAKGRGSAKCLGDWDTILRSPRKSLWLDLGPASRRRTELQWRVLRVWRDS